MEQIIAFAGNHAMLSAAWVGLVVVILVISIKISMSPIKKISPQELTFLVNKEEGLALDIRDEKAYKASHILDAVNLSNDKITKNGFTSLEKQKNKPIIVVCNAGISAAKVANDLFKAGFTQVSLLKGGMNAWTGAGLPVKKSNR